MFICRIFLEIKHKIIDIIGMSDRVKPSLKYSKKKEQKINKDRKNVLKWLCCLMVQDFQKKDELMKKGQRMCYD